MMKNVASKSNLALVPCPSIGPICLVLSKAILVDPAKLEVHFLIEGQSLFFNLKFQILKSNSKEYN